MGVVRRIASWALKALIIGVSAGALYLFYLFYQVAASSGAPDVLAFFSPPWALGLDAKIERHGDIPIRLRAIHRKIIYSGDLPGSRVVTAIAWSPDGKRLAYAYDWGTHIAVSDLNGKTISVTPHIDGPNVEPWLYFIGASKIIYKALARNLDIDVFSVWDAQTGQLVRSVKGPMQGRVIENGKVISLGNNHVRHFFVSADEMFVAVTLANNRGVYVYRTSDWKFVRLIAPDGGGGAPFIGNTHRIVSGVFPNSFLIVDADSGTMLSRFRVPGLDDASYLRTLNGRMPIHLTVSPNGKFLFAEASVSTEQKKYPVASRVLSDAALSLSDASSRLMVPVNGVGLNQESTMGPISDGGYSKGHRNAPQVFRISDGARIAMFDKFEYGISAVGWVGNGRYIAMIDNGSNRLVIWDPFSRYLNYITLNIPSGPLRLAISPDGHRIAVSLKNGFVIYELH